MHKLEWDVCAAEGRGSRAHTVTKAHWLPPRLEDRRETHEKYIGRLQQKYLNQGPTSSCWTEGYSVEGEDGGSSKARPSELSKRPFLGEIKLKKKVGKHRVWKRISWSGKRASLEASREAEGQHREPCLSWQDRHKADEWKESLVVGVRTWAMKGRHRGHTWFSY